MAGKYGIIHTVMKPIFHRRLEAGKTNAAGRAESGAAAALTLGGSEIVYNMS